MTATRPERFRDHFENPRGEGRLDNANVSVRVVNPACGDVLELSGLLTDQEVVDLRFHARGCSSSIAAASGLVELTRGQCLERVRQIEQKDLEAVIGKLAPLSQHAFDLALEGLKKLLIEGGRPYV